MSGVDDEMFMIRSLNVTPKTIEQHLIARSNKSVAYLTNNKRLFVLLKLTTDRHTRHEESCGLFATAELFVLLSYPTIYNKLDFNFIVHSTSLYAGERTMNR